MFQDLLSRIRTIEEQIKEPKKSDINIEKLNSSSDNVFKLYKDFYENTVLDLKQNVFQKEHETRKITNDPKMQTAVYEKIYKNFYSQKQSIDISFQSIDTEDPKRPIKQGNEEKGENNINRKFKPKKKKLRFDNTPPRPKEEKVIEHIVDPNALSSKESTSSGVVKKKIPFSTASANKPKVPETKQSVQETPTKSLSQSIPHSTSGAFNSPAKSIIGAHAISSAISLNKKTDEEKSTSETSNLEETKPDEAKSAEESVKAEESTSSDTPKNPLLGKTPASKPLLNKSLNKPSLGQSLPKTPLTNKLGTSKLGNFKSKIKPL